MSDTSTRSGMLWEVERILTECYELGSLPQILLMENVPQIHNEQNIKDFHKWQVRLEELGYKSYWQDLIATDYGIPQTRNRCFMVSILGNYSYTFPNPIPLELKLKDMLEDNVDEKYYLSEKAVNGLTNQMQKKHKPNLIDIQSEPNKPFSTLTCGYMKQGHYETYLKIKNNTKQGYLEAKEGDGVDISSRMKNHRGTVQKDKIQTITTSGGNDRGVVTIGNYSPSNHNASRVVDNDGLAPTVMENHGTVTATQTNDLRIRKLTPRECFRLMGVKDEDFDKVKKNQSDSSLYHLAGDSIVVDVLSFLFKQLI